MTRETTRVEFPPIPGKDLKEWAEQIIDYLQRTETQKQSTLDDHEARITALEP